MSGTLVWDAPGKGDWRGLHDHFTRALTPEYWEILRTGMMEGEAVWFADYGLPVRTMEPRLVNGRVFISAAPLVGPYSNRFPPAGLMRLAMKVAPPFRLRARAAATTLERRPWRSEAAWWYEGERARFVTANERLDSIDPGALDIGALADHLREVRAHLVDGYRTHFRLHGADLIPIGLLVARAADFGIDAMEATALLAGCSPASTGGDLSPWRLVTGYDLDERCAAELPAVAVSGGTSVAVPDAGELRARIPAEHREEWDRLVDDARVVYGLRDDNGLLTAAWPAGLLRRAMLEAGRRLVERGALADAELAVELTVDELVAGIAPRSVPDAAARLVERRRLSSEPPPAQLGVTLDLPLDALPPAMRTITRALLAVRDLAMTPPGDRDDLGGTGIGTEVVVGRACVATDAAEALARFEPGDIIVTAGTCPAWNTILAVAGGVVTEEGGPLSHAAIIARELGLPALVGAAHAVTHIPDGATVELDPKAGRVRVL